MGSRFIPQNNNCRFAPETFYKYGAFEKLSFSFGCFK